MTNLIYKKMTQVMVDIGAIGKDSDNKAQGFKFRGIESVMNKLYPALTKHGVFMTPRCTQFTQELKDVTRSSGKLGVDKHIAIQMEYDFYAEDGSKVTVGPIPAEGLDSGDKATNKALSAALKYALIQTFSVPTEDMAEADKESPEIGSSRSKGADKPEAASLAPIQTAPTTEAKPSSGFKKPTAKKAAAAEPEEQATTVAPASNGAAAGGWS
jgi:hypothetical protein